MKLLAAAFIFLGSAIIMLGPSLWRRAHAALAAPVMFESLESITGRGAPVFNEINLQTSPSKDVWIMRQAHFGLGVPRKSWDRLAIVVDKTRSPATAKFFELAPGDLEFSAHAIALKATCMQCHGNGPRAIRPNFESTSAPLALADRLKILIWNIRIKAYGRTDSFEGVHFVSGQPFHSPLSILWRPLRLESCTRCHFEEGSRNILRIEQLATIQFMVKNNFMPPPPFAISHHDLDTINRLAR